MVNITPCQTMQNIASDPTQFFSDYKGGGGSGRLRLSLSAGHQPEPDLWADRGGSYPCAVDPEQHALIPAAKQSSRPGVGFAA